MKLIITGIILLIVGIISVLFSLHWAFNPMVQNETNQLSDVAPRISSILPIIALGIIGAISGLTISVLGIIKFIRKKLNRISNQQVELT